MSENSNEYTLNFGIPKGAKGDAGTSGSGGEVDLSGYAKKSELSTVATSGSYNDLTNKPTIPSEYNHPTSHPASMITGLSKVATSGLYSDLTGKPTKLSEFENDLSNITSAINLNSEKISELNSQMNSIKSNHAIYNDRELKEGNNYALDVANFVGQGLYPTGSSENNKFRCAVFHNYVDTEVLTIDNVGEMPSIFVRNARNSERRIDKEPNFIPKSNYLDFRQGFMNEDGTTHSFVQMFKMDYLGDMYFPNNRNDVATHKIYAVSETLASKDYAFQIGSYYNTRFIARFDYENNKSALNIILDTAKANTRLLSPNTGLKLTANKGDAYLEALNGNVVLRGSNGVYVYKDGANLPIISFISNKPETSTSNGNKGDCFVDNTHLYICYETNKWIRIAKDSSW